MGLCQLHWQEKKAHNSRRRLERNSAQPHANQKLHFLVDIQEKVLAGKGLGHERWAKVFNLKQMAKAMIFMQEHEIGSYEELSQKTSASTEKYEVILASVKADEIRMQEIAARKRVSSIMPRRRMYLLSIRKKNPICRIILLLVKLFGFFLPKKGKRTSSIMARIADREEGMPATVVPSSHVFLRQES